MKKNFSIFLSYFPTINNMKIKNHIVEQKIKNKTVLFNTEKSRLFTFNDIGRQILQLIVEGHNREEIITALTNVYEVDRSHLENDVDEFIKTLQKEDILA